MSAKVETKNSAKKFATPHERAKSKTKQTTDDIIRDPYSIAELKQQARDAKAAKAAAKAKAAPKVRTGKLGSVLGFSAVSVIRRMGQLGWDYDTANAALKAAGIEAAQHTVKIGLKRGKNGEKRIAPLSSKELDALKVKKSIKGKGNPVAA